MTRTGCPVLFMDFSERVMGRPGFLHGGALSGLMEMAGFAALRTELARRGEDAVLKPVNVQVEFMRGGTELRTFAARADHPRGPPRRADQRIRLAGRPGEADGAGADENPAQPRRMMTVSPSAGAGGSLPSSRCTASARARVSTAAGTPGGSNTRSALPSQRA